MDWDTVAVGFLSFAAGGLSALTYRIHSAELEPEPDEHATDFDWRESPVLSFNDLGGDNAELAKREE